MVINILYVRNEDGKIYNASQTLAVCYDINGVLFKIGKPDDVEKYFKEVTLKYINDGFNEIAEEIRYTVLPENQELVDKIFQISGYVKILNTFNK